MSSEEQKVEFRQEKCVLVEGVAVEENFENLLGKDIDFEELMFGRNQPSNYKCSGSSME